MDYNIEGLILFLESEDELAGVIGHEMAHADQRHSTRQLTKILGVQILLDAVLNRTSNNEKTKQTVGQITTAIVGLKFSRTNESEADDYSVRYLCPTDYPADGSAGFFKKMQDQPSPSQWLSTHPSPKNRVERITKMHLDLGCKGFRKYVKEYNEIKRLVVKMKRDKTIKKTTGNKRKKPGKVIMPKSK